MEAPQQTPKRKKNAARLLIWLILIVIVIIVIVAVSNKRGETPLTTDPDQLLDRGTVREDLRGDVTIADTTRTNDGTSEVADSTTSVVESAATIDATLDALDGVLGVEDLNDTEITNIINDASARDALLNEYDL